MAVTNGLMNGGPRRGTAAKARARTGLVAAAAAVLVLLMLLGACSNPFRMHFYPSAADVADSAAPGGGSGESGAPGDGADAPDAETGSVTISMATMSPMTIMPDFPAITTYDLELTRAGYTPIVFAGETATSKTVTDLAIGQWTVTVHGNDGSGTRIASGSAPVDVVAGGPTPVTVQLSYFAFEGQGDLEIDVTFPDAVGVDAAEYTRTPLGGSPDGPHSLVIVDDDGADSSVRIADTSIDAGPYTVVMTFERAGEMVATVVEAVLVYGNLSTSPDGNPEITLTEDDFNSAPPAPTGLTIVDNQDNSAGISWDASAVYTETGFTIERHESSDFSDGSPANFTVGANVQSYDDNTVTPRTHTYYYRVKATNSFGDSPWLEAGSGITVTHVHPGPTFVIDGDAELAAFPGYTQVQGNLSIINISGGDLSELTTLEQVDGNLSIHSNSGLAGLEGLENLATVGGEIYLSNNPALTDLSGIGVAGTVGSLDAQDDGVQALYGLENVTNFTGDIYVRWNTTLPDLSGLDGLETVGGGIFISDNSNVSSLSGLGSLRTVGTQISITNNAGLTDISLPGLETVTGNVTVSRNDQLETVSMPALTTVDGSFNHNLNSRSAAGQVSVSLPALETVGDSITMDGYDSSYGYAKVHTVTLGTAGTPLVVGATGAGQDVDIWNQHSLESIHADALTQVHGDLSLWDIPLLGELHLDGLESLGEGFSLDGDTAITALSLPSLVSVGGSFRLDNYNDSSLLESISAPLLTSIGGNLQVTEHEALTTIGAFGPDLTVGNDLNVTENWNLSDLTGLEGIRSVTGDVSIWRNSSGGTVSLSMSNLETVGEYISIHENGFAAIDLAVQDVGTDVTLQRNAWAAAISMDNLHTVGGNFAYNWNGSSTAGTVASFAALESVGGSLSFDGYYDGWDGQLESLTLGTEGTPLVVGTDDGSNQYDFSMQSCDSLTTLDARALTTVYGGVTLRHLSLSDLTGLSNLTTIARHLDVRWSSTLTSLAGLSNVQTLGMEDGGTMGLYISGCDALESLVGLGSLQSVAGDLTVSSTSPVLASLSALSSLTSVGGSIDISVSTPTDLSGLEGITGSVAGDLRITNGNSLEDISALSGITDVQGDVFLSSLPHLSSVNLSNLQSVDGEFRLNNCDDVANIDPLTQLTSVGGDLELDGNQDLADLGDTTTRGLCNLSSLGGRLYLYQNANLSDISALDEVTVVGADQAAEGKDAPIYLQSNPKLGSLMGLDQVQEIRGDLHIRDCGTAAGYELVDLTELGALTTINGRVYVFGNSELTSLFGASSALEVIKGNATGQAVYIQDNPSLIDLAGITGSGGTRVTTVASITINNNDALTDLSGLDGLEDVNGDVYVNNNAAITTFPVLASLTQISGTLDLGYNGTESNRITDLGFTGLTQVSTLRIRQSFFEPTSYADNAAVEAHFSGATITTTDVANNDFTLP